MEIGLAPAVGARTVHRVISADPVLRPCTSPTEWPALVRIWRSAVEATHDFLTPEDVAFFESRMTSDYLPGVEVTVADVDGVPAGFSGLAGNSLEMLFVDDAHRGRGLGSALLDRALADHPDLVLDVNEQNPQAVGFYERHGFVTLGRSETDADGRPFPILHMARSTY
ncbi:toxin-antitoxin system, toxin component, GNAT family [Prescottella equi ATCC 33707]|uniref:Toxin-antitoxin system, toxin component, GNAT family n=1 Tax=Prescottella equi ATCC 33707 TaxID=525370 RepID=E9T6Y7_RHOHA|nr:toxin-antitoxin system, toxin component, GNAT family [Prescottella equi ATCC 33707]